MTSTMASQNSSLTIVYSTIYSCVGQRKHQSSASLAFVWGFYRWPVNSPHKGPMTRKMHPFDDVIMAHCGPAVRCNDIYHQRLSVKKAGIRADLKVILSYWRRTIPSELGPYHFGWGFGTGRPLMITIRDPSHYDLGCHNSKIHN